MNRILPFLSLLLVSVISYSQGPTFTKSINNSQNINQGSYSYTTTLNYKLEDAGYGESPTALKLGFTNTYINELTYKGYKASQLLKDISFPLSVKIQASVNGQVIIKRHNSNASIFTTFNVGQVQAGSMLSVYYFSDEFRHRIFSSFGEKVTYNDVIPKITTVTLSDISIGTVHDITNKMDGEIRRIKNEAAAKKREDEAALKKAQQKKREDEAALKKVQLEKDQKRLQSLQEDNIKKDESTVDNYTDNEPQQNAYQKYQEKQRAEKNKKDEQKKLDLHNKLKAQRESTLRIEKNFQENLASNTELLMHAFSPHSDVNLIKASQSPDQALQNFSNELRRIEQAQKRQFDMMMQQVNKISEQIAKAKTESEKNASVTDALISGGAIAASIIALNKEKKKIERAYYSKVDQFRSELLNKNRIDAKNSIAYAVKERDPSMEEYYIKLSDYHNCFNNHINNYFSYQNTSWTRPGNCKQYSKPTTQNLDLTDYDIAVRKYSVYQKRKDKVWLDATKFYLNKELQKRPNNAKAYFFRAKLSDNIIDKFLDVKHAHKLEVTNASYQMENEKLKLNYQKALFSAIDNNNTTFIKKAIKYNLQFGFVNQKGNSSIIESIAQDKHEVLDLLIKSIPNYKTTIQNNLQNYLYIATENNALKVFKKLESYGANREYESTTDGSVLYTSIQYNSNAITTYLLSKNVNISNTLAFIKKREENNYLYKLGQSILEYSLLNHETIETTTLLKNIETVLSYDNKIYYAKMYGNETSLDYVVDYDLAPVFELFLKYGADINTTSKPGYSLVTRSISRKSNSIFDILIREDVKINIPVVGDGTLLHTAIKAKNNHALDVLLEKNIPINIVDQDNNTALLLACNSKNRTTINKILDLNPMLNVQNTKGNTALILLIKNNMTELVHRVLEKEIEVNIVDHQGKTAIHYAVINNNIEIVRSLINNNVDLLVEDKYLNTPLKLARKNKNIEIIDLIKQQIKSDKKYSTSAEIQHVKCKSGKDGSINIEVQYGTPPYKYVWEHDNTINSGQISNLKVGEYTVTITDNRMQTLKKTMLIQEPDSLIVTIEKTDETTIDYGDGKVKAIVNGGAKPYKYLWSDSISSPKINNLKRGRYELTVTDHNNCTVKAFTEIEGNRDNEIAYINLAESYISLNKNRKGTNTLTKVLKINPNNTQALLMRSKMYYNSNKNKHALKDLNKLIAIEPTSYEAIEYRIRINEQSESNTELLTDYSTLLDYNPKKYGDLYYKRGLLYYELQEKQASQDDFSSNIKSDSINELSYYYRALLHIEKNEIEDASKDIKSINHANLDQEKAEKLNLISLSYYNKGMSEKGNNIDSAIINFTNALLISEFHTDSYYERGTLLQKNEKYILSIKDFSSAIGNNADHLKAYYHRGLSYHYLKMHLEAIYDFDKVTTLDKKHERAYYFQGLSYVSLEKHSQAIVSFSHAIKISKSNEVYHAQGLSYYTLTDYKSAVNSFQNAINENKSHAKSYYYKGLSLKNLNLLKKAEVEFENAVTIKPDYHEAYQEKASANMLLEKYKTAIEDYTNVLKHDSTDVNAYTSRAKAYKEIKKFDLSILDLERATTLDKNLLQKEMYFEMGYLYKKIKEYTKAVTFYKSSLDSASDTETLFAIAGLYSLQNETDECLIWVQKTLDSNGLYTKKIKKSKDFKNMKKNKQFKSLLKS